ncbi:MAG: helix-turn-helix domain-containing protein [Acidimicrobiales bacterium]
MGTVHRNRRRVGERRTSERRLALRAAAARRITADGVAKTCAADIAADCGVSERTFFRYFTTKEQAALDPLVEWIDGIVSAIEDAPYTRCPCSRRPR